MLENFIQNRDSLVAVELVVVADYSMLVDYLEGVTEDEVVVLKLELEHSFVFAENRD